MDNRERVARRIGLLAFLAVQLACWKGTPATTGKVGEERMARCFDGVNVDLGIPDAAVFFLAEVADESEPLANRRWALAADGTVTFSRNEAPFDGSKLPGEPFNRPFWERPIAQVPVAEFEAFLSWLEGQGALDLPAEVGPPPDLVVKGGVDRWVVVRWKGRAVCSRLHPGAPLSDPMKERFGDLVSPHIRREAP